MGLALSTVLLTGVVALAQTTQPPSYQRDGEILFKETSRTPFPGFADEALNCDPYASVVEYRGWNKRTVGNGVVGQTVDTRGSLIDPQTLIDNGLISATARISFWTRVQGGGPVQPMPSSHLKVNDCPVQPAVVFHFVGDNANKRVQFVAEIPAHCLLYGVRSSADAAEPEPKENVIQLITATAPEVGDCKECGDRAGCHLRTSLVGDVDWLRQKVPGFAAKMDVSGEEEARSFEHDWRLRAEFEALAPIALVHGYRSDIAYWSRFDPDRETAENAFDVPLKEKHVGFEAIHSGVKKEGGDFHIAPADVRTVGDQVKESLAALARKHGADHVNVITHSMGALWAREAITQLKASNPSENLPSVFMLVTVAPMHKGSILADFAYLQKEKYKVEDGVPLDAIEKFVAWLKGTNDSTYDATTFRMLSYNAAIDPIHDVGVSMSAKGRRHLLKKWSVPTSFNRNENCNAKGLELVECDSPTGDCVREKREYMPLTFGLKEITEEVLQRRSEKLQWYLSSRVWLGGGQWHAEINNPPDPVNCPGGGSDLIPCTPGCPDKRYPLNDFTLRTDQMFFADYVPFVPLTELPEPPPRAFLHRTHAGIADAFLARSILREIMQAETQRAMRR
jgi:pimeloyl-ACP methyl ester carboxylesterase